MKASILNIKNKGILFLIVSLVISHSSFAQNKLVSLATSLNYNFLIPIICVLGLAAFLITSFIKEKNH